MEGVAARAGVSKQSVYRRWSSRGDLLVDLYIGTSTDENPSFSGARFKDRFESYLRWSVQRLFDPARANILRALAMEGQADAAVRDALMTRIVQPRLAQGRELILHGQKHEEVRRDLDVDTALELLFGSVWFNLLITGNLIDPTWEKRTLKLFFRLTENSPKRR
ncbi:transcriptional regulator, TetR family [Enhydrobacter aerosaccus]|uniref:Transcriptional regulator, TetR family n=2 Tax=Enhydrobacter aerosaccus TaxID=225324 RepID=A0A1T4JK36_9HYPH|nr:transcriptional regulator, TetR family [Enhydrobacter aerosaccus]